MKISVIAIAPDDGWAFIEKDNRIFLLRPPYTSSYQTEASEKTVETAINSHGFEKCNVVLDGISEAVRLLEAKYVESKKKQGIDLPSSQELRGLLKYASTDVLLRYVRKARKELIPEGRFDAALSIATELMKLDAAKQDPEIYRTGMEIFQAYIEKCMQQKSLLTKTAENRRRNWTSAFPNIAKKYRLKDIIEWQKSISTTGQLLCVGVDRD
ncbi:hypothetical protein MUP77_00460 [Candidatus Bathyarchaeota archaeon]|nr:hypothetical protein [Candidatus Bathyarchaeota archaeon]